MKQTDKDFAYEHFYPWLQTGLLTSVGKYLLYFVFLINTFYNFSSIFAALTKHTNFI